jgi:hypothetical protein
MSNRKLTILGIVAAVMVVLTVIQARFGRTPAKRWQGGAYLIQGLEPAKIAKIVIGMGDDAVKLIRQGRHFVVGNKDNYPAVTSKINNLLTSCLDIRTIELITSDAANHKELEVTEEKATGVVKFLKKDEQIITGIVVGKSESQTKSTYVRLVSSNDVYTTAEAPRIQSSAMDYVDKEIVNVDDGNVVRVTVTGLEGSYTLRVDGSNKGNIVLEDIPAGKKSKTSDCKQVLSGLSHLSFDDVKSEASFKEVELKFDRTYVCELKDSTVYTFRISKTDAKTHVKCSAEYTDEAGLILESVEELKDKEAKILAQDRASDFTKKHQGWIYEVSKWKAKNLTTALSELLEEEEEEAVDEASSANSSEDAKSEESK